MTSSQQRHESLSGWANIAISRMSRVIEAFAPPAHRTSEPLATDNNPFPGCPRVLLADDEWDSRFATDKLLALRGIRPVHAADGAEAVALACGHHFDLILMDIQMPILDGLNAAAQIRRYERVRGHPSAPIVAYTSGAVADDEVGLRAFGIDGALEKPCTAASLEACLLRWCIDGSRPVAGSA